MSLVFLNTFASLKVGDSLNVLAASGPEAQRLIAHDQEDDKAKNFMVQWLMAAYSEVVQLLNLAPGPEFATPEIKLPAGGASYRSGAALTSALHGERRGQRSVSLVVPHDRNL